MDITNLVRKNIRDLVPYSSAREEYTGEAAILLDANENPYNAPFNRYPDPMQTALKSRLASIKQVDPASLFIGNGSDEAIDLLFRVFCEPGRDNVVSISPSYGMYQVCADINNVEVKKVLLNEDYSLNTQALRETCDEHTRLLFLCSPNNPTSNSFDPSEIMELVESLKIIVVLDEAYIDFSTRESLAEKTSSYNNLVVLQTLSKAWGLAGIRLGFAIADPQIITLMNRVKYPYNVNALTQNFAIEALEKEEQMKEWVDRILSQRTAVEKRLKMFRFVQKVFPSDANFLLVRVKDPKAVYKFLVDRKIIIRDRSTVELCEGALRITVGTQPENDDLINALMDYQRDFIESCEI